MKPKPPPSAPLYKPCDRCGNTGTWTCPACNMRLCPQCRQRHPAHK